MSGLTVELLLHVLQCQYCAIPSDKKPEPAIGWPQKLYAFEAWTLCQEAQTMSNDDIKAVDISCERCQVHLGVVECDEAPAAYCPTCWKAVMREGEQLAREAKVIAKRKGKK